MGMYCWCGARRNPVDADGNTVWDRDCTCDLTGFVKCSIGLPSEEGEFEVRVQSGSADIYQTTAHFSLTPKIVENEGYYNRTTSFYHWDAPFDSWDSDSIMMWRPIRDK